MIISFDLDDTLISNKFELEKPNLFQRFFGLERIRKGTIDLFKEIKKQKHQRGISKKDIYCSKFPPIFNIDIHVDDSIGVEMEGLKYGFKTIIISETDENWTQTILSKIHKII